MSEPGTSHTRVPEYALLSACALFAFLAVIGWLFRVSFLVQTVGDSAVIQFTTAACILLLCLSVFFTIRGKRAAAWAGSLGVFIIGGLSLAANIGGFERFFLDSLFVQPFMDDRVSPPGRMSSASAVCVISLAVANLLILPPAAMLNRAIASLVGALALGYALFTLTGYAGHYFIGYGWGVVTGMSLLAAICISLVALVSAMFAWRGFVGRGEESVSWAALGAAAAGSGAIILFAMLLELRETAVIYDQSESDIQQLALETASEFTQSRSALERMAVRVDRHDFTEADWRPDAKSYTRDIPGFRFVVWARSRGPALYEADPELELSPAFIDRYIREVTRLLPAQNPERSHLVGPVELPSGEPGFAIVSAVDSAASEGGDYVFAVVDPYRYLNEFTLLSVWQNYDVSIGTPDGPVMDHRTGRALDAERFSFEAALPEGRQGWVMRAAPTVDSIVAQRSRVSEAVLIAGLVLANLLGLALQLNTRARRHALRLREAYGSLEAREEHLANLVSAMPDAVFTVAENGSIETMNPVATLVFRCDEDDLLGLTIGDIIADDEDATATLNVRLRTSRISELYGRPYLTTAQRPDGTTMPVSLAVAPFKTPDGPRYVWIVRDMTRLVEAEDMLRRKSSEVFELAQRYEKLKLCGAIGMAHTGLSGRFIDCNETFAEMLGYEVEELEGMLVSELNYEEDAELADRLIAELLGGQRDNYRITKRYIHKAGHVVWVDVAVALMRDPEGEPMYAVGIALDVTQRMETRIALEESEARLKDVNKELESIVYVASHDLRSPLVNLQGFSRQLETSVQHVKNELAEMEISYEKQAVLEEDLEERIPEALSFIESSTIKMDRLIKGLLRLSRLGRTVPHPKKLDMNALMQSVINAMQFTLTKDKIDVRVEELPECWGDEDQVNQVFSNLIDNAIKYRSRDRESWIRVSGEKIDGVCVYIVEDNGLGIDAAHQEIIFEIFHRLSPKDEVGGEGLGLSVVRRLLDRSKGTIDVESTPGEGSRFIVTLPAASRAHSEGNQPKVVTHVRDE